MSKNDDVPPGGDEAIKRLSKDIAEAAKNLTHHEARFLVDAYYTMQEGRKRSDNQVRALGESQEPNSVLSWYADQNGVMERQVARALDKYTQAHLMGSWMRNVKGIGPVLSAGLLAHIDIKQAPTAGHIWRYSGLDSTSIWVSTEVAAKWIKEQTVPLRDAVDLAAKHFGRNPATLLRLATTDREGNEVNLTVTTLSKAISRRPWNAKMKTLCWKIGQSFMKLSNDPECYYGQVYRARKTWEIEQNAAGKYAAQAAEGAARVGTKTIAYSHYKDGHLPPGHIDARARRYAVKLFLSHLHDEWYRREFGKEPPLPYPIAILGHAHYIAPPKHPDVAETV